MKWIAPAAMLFSMMPLLAFAEDSWDWIRLELYDDRPLNDAANVIAIDAPKRTYDDARTDIAAHVIAPAGLRIGTVTVVLGKGKRRVVTAKPLLVARLLLVAISAKLVLLPNQSYSTRCRGAQSVVAIRYCQVPRIHRNREAWDRWLDS